MDPAAKDTTRHDLECALAGDTTAWTRLVSRHEAHLRVLAHYRLGPTLRARTTIDDLIQETWCAALARLNEFECRGRGALAAWLATILNRRILSAGRRRHATPPLRTSAEESAGAVLARVTASESSVSEVAAATERSEAIRHELDRLEPPLRDTMLLRLFEGLDGREVADRLGVHESTVSVRCKKALAQIGQRLRQLEEP